MGECDAGLEVDLAVHRTEELSRAEVRMLCGMLDAAFDGRFADEDWQHTVGGLHVLVQRGGVTLAHGAVVPRTLIAGDRTLSVGYVEGVATRPDSRRRGYASRAMQTAGTIITENFDLGALATGSPEFYARLGWESWQGPTYVNTPDGQIRTADEDAGVMVLRTDRTLGIDLTTELTCDWRPGDVW